MTKMWVAAQDQRERHMVSERYLPSRVGMSTLATERGLGWQVSYDANGSEGTVDARALRYLNPLLPISGRTIEMTVAELIRELQTLDPNREVSAGPNHSEDGPMQPIVGINTTYCWLLTDAREA